MLNPWVIRLNLEAEPEQNPDWVSKWQHFDWGSTRWVIFIVLYVNNW